MVPESELKSSDGGLVPEGEGWFVLNAREAKWLDGHFGAYTRFEGDARFPQLGFHLGKALENGVTEDELIEVITHLAFYAGWPNAMTAMTQLKEIVEKRDQSG